MAELLLPQAVVTHRGAHRLWLKLAEPWTRGEFAARLRSPGVGIVTSDAFALAEPPEAVRLGLSGPATRAALADGLRTIADLLHEFPALSTMIV